MTPELENWKEDCRQSKLSDILSAVKFLGSRFIYCVKKDESERFNMQQDSRFMRTKMCGRKTSAKRKQPPI